MLISASGAPRTFLYAVPLRGRVESRTPKKQTNALGDSRFLWRSSTFKFNVKCLSSTLTADSLSSNFLAGGWILFQEYIHDSKKNNEVPIFHAHFTPPRPEIVAKASTSFSSHKERWDQDQNRASDLLFLVRVCMYLKYAVFCINIFATCKVWSCILEG